MIPVTFMQTCDTVRYVPLLDIGSRTVKSYITKYGYNYISYIGLRRGVFAWQASYNRIPMLMEIIETGYNGWVCYMDADSYIADLNFDLDGYLSNKTDIVLIAAHSCVQPPMWFDINNGVFLINLAHANGKALVRAWHARYSAIPDEQFNAADVWSDIPNDQQLLHEAMQEIAGLEQQTIVDMSDSKLLNYHNGRFIRQILREDGGTIDERAEKMRVDVSSILLTASEIHAHNLTSIHADVSILEESFIRAIYRTFLLRDPGMDEFYHAIKRFRTKQCTIEQEIKDCLASSEFAEKSTEFLKHFAPTSLAIR